jgi:hypothetical protein
MTKREMAEALAKHYPLTTVAYWLKYDKGTVALNYSQAGIGPETTPAAREAGRVHPE